MTRRLNLLPAAQNDLSDIWAYTIWAYTIWAYTAERWSLALARIYAAAMTDLLVVLCDQPEIAPECVKSVPPVGVHRLGRIW